MSMISIRMTVRKLFVAVIGDPMGNVRPLVNMK